MISCLEFVEVTFFDFSGLDRVQSVTAASLWLFSLLLQSTQVEQKNHLLLTSPGISVHSVHQLLLKQITGSVSDLDLRPIPRLQ